MPEETVESLRGLLRLETARAERAEQSLGAVMVDRFHDEAIKTASAVIDGLRSSLATAEAENARLKLALNDSLGVVVEQRNRIIAERDAAVSHAATFDAILGELTTERAVRLKAEAEVKRLNEENAPCPICNGTPPVSGLPCACGGSNSVYEALTYATTETARLRAAVERLVGVGNGLASRVRSYSSMMYDSDAATMEAVSWTAAVAAAREVAR